MSDLLSPTGAEPFNIDPASLSNLVGVQSTLDLTKLEGVLASVVKEMKRANTRISHLEREVEDEKNKSTTAKEEAENLQRSLTATVAELRAQTAKVNKVEEELQTLREEFETEKIENEDSHGKNDARLTGCENRIRELHDAKSEAEEASKKEGATLTARMAMVERSLASKAKEDFVQNLAQDLKAAHQQLKGLEQLAKKVDVDVFNTLRDETKKGISALEERLGDQKAEVDKEIAALNESFEDLKFGEERNGGAAVMEMMNEMEGVRAEMNAMTSRNNNLRSEMTSRVQAVEKDVPELDMRLSTQISDIRRIVDSVGETSAVPTAGGGVDPIALKKLKVELEDVMATREELQQLAEPLHERMERAEGDVREIRRAMTDVKRAVSELRSISNTKDIREKVDNVEKKLDELAKSMTAFASEEEVEEKMNNVKDELSQKLEIGWATDFEQTAASQATRIKALEEGLPKIRDRFKSKADKNDITKVKKMISELELTMENVGAGSRVKCISCDRSLDRMSEVKPTHIDGFVTSGKSHIRDNFFGKMPRSVGGEHTADRVVVAPLSSFPMPGQGEDKDRPYSSPRIPTRLPPPPASASGSPATAGASPRTKRISQDEGGATKGSGGAGGSVEVGSGLFETPTMEPFPKRKTPRKNPNGHYQELESKLETTTLEPSQWE